MKHTVTEKEWIRIAHLKVEDGLVTRVWEDHEGLHVEVLYPRNGTKKTTKN